jgi:hypothetical protein
LPHINCFFAAERQLQIWEDADRSSGRSAIVLAQAGDRNRTYNRLITNQLLCLIELHQHAKQAARFELAKRLYESLMLPITSHLQFGNGGRN